MRYTYFFFLLAIFFANTANAQMPFQQKGTIEDMTPTKLAKIISLKGYQKMNFKHIGKSMIVNPPAARPFRSFRASQNLVKAYNDNQREAEDKAHLLNQVGTSIVVGSDVANLFPTLNGEIVDYRICISRKGTKRHYLPLSIVSKVSGNSTNTAGTVNDATSFFGAPLTLRATPTFRIEANENRATAWAFGTYHDVRLVTVGNTVTNKVDAGFGMYNAVGFSIFGEGYVQDNTDNPTKYEGSWVFSALLYNFSSGGKFNNAVFGSYEKKNLSGVEALFRFKTSSDQHSRFNLLIGGNYGFTPGASNYHTWSLRFGVGS